MGMLDGKVAVITGAGSGMAKASVKVFVREGAKVVAADISGAEQDTAEEVGGDVARPCTATSPRRRTSSAWWRAAVEEFGRLDVMLNVAGIAQGMLTADITEEHYRQQMDVDLFGVIFGMKHGIRAMLANEDGGAIVNWSSLGGLGALRTRPCTTRRSTAWWAPPSARPSSTGRTTSASTPCARASSTRRSWAPTPNGRRASSRRRPSDAAVRPSEVAEVAAFLSSDRASFVTGVCIPVDGGWGAKLA